MVKVMDVYRFSQSRTGQDFFRGTLPRIAEALDTIAENLRHLERMEVLELAIALPPAGKISCKDGFEFVLGDSKFGRNNFLIAFPTQQDSLIDEYAEEHRGEYPVSYCPVPALIVAQLILNHGGLVGR
jgi:hypothetical protein